MANNKSNIATSAESIQGMQPHLVHTHDVQLDADYSQWLIELKQRYRSAQLKAAVKVNAEKLLFNWQLGRDLVQKKAEERWGAGVVEQVSLDLRGEFPREKGFSATNLWEMKRWYLYYTTPQALEKLHQLGGELLLSDYLSDKKLHQLGGESSSTILKQSAEETAEDGKQNQYGAEFPYPFAFVPWRHHVEIIHKAADLDEALFYIKGTIQEGWSRQGLMVAMHSDLYHTHHGALTNFNAQLQLPHSTLAQDMVKDNYDFSFVSIDHSPYSEQDLEDALEQNITRFLLELGNGFAFIGRQKEVLISGKDRRVDLLFYHIRLRCYVVVELKAKPFEPEFASKLNFYVNAVNRYVKHADDNPTIGLLICTGFDQTEAELTFDGINSPLALAAYHGVRISDYIPSEEALRQRVRQLEAELRTSRKLIHQMAQNGSLSPEDDS